MMNCVGIHICSKFKASTIATNRKLLMQTKQLCPFLSLVLIRVSQANTQLRISTLILVQVVSTVRLHKFSMMMKFQQSFRALPEQLLVWTKRLTKLLANFFSMREKRI